MSEAGKAALARSAMAAVEPLVELFLESPVPRQKACCVASSFIRRRNGWPNRARMGRARRMCACRS
jgi:hypothetical protein